MDHRRASEVPHVDPLFARQGTGQPAAAPDPVADERIDEGTDQEGINEIRGELRPLGHGTRDDCRRGPREDQLEHELGVERHRGPVQGGEDPLVGVAGRGRVVSPREEEPAKSHERVAVAEHDAEPDGPVGQRPEAEIHQVLHHDVVGVLRAGQSSFDVGESRLHPEHQERRQHHPHRVQQHLVVGHLGGQIILGRRWPRDRQGPDHG